MKPRELKRTTARRTATKLNGLTVIIPRAPLERMPSTLAENISKRGGAYEIVEFDPVVHANLLEAAATYMHCLDEYAAGWKTAYMSSKEDVKMHSDNLRLRIEGINLLYSRTQQSQPVVNKPTQMPFCPIIAVDGIPFVPNTR